MQCDACEGEIPETAKVCGYCGHRRLIACAGCGHSVGVTALACGNCGRLLDPLAEASDGDSAVPVGSASRTAHAMSSDETPPTRTAPEPAVRRPAVEEESKVDLVDVADPVAAQVELVDDVDPDPAPEPARAIESEIVPVVAEAGGRRRGVLVGLALVVLVAAGAVAGWFLLADDDGGSSTQEPEPDSVTADRNWVGAWESTDLDGSGQWLLLEPSDDFPEYQAVGVYYDDRSSSGPCAGDAAVANLIVTQTSDTGIVVEGTIWCPSFAETPSTPLMLAGDHCDDPEAGCVLRQTGTTWQWEITGTEFEWALTWEQTDDGGGLRGPIGTVDNVSWARSDNPNLIEIRFEGTRG